MSASEASWVIIVIEVVIIEVIVEVIAAAGGKDRFLERLLGDSTSSKMGALRSTSEVWFNDDELWGCGSERNKCWRGGG